MTKQNANAVISDILVRDGNLSFTDFEDRFQNGSVIGYGNFRVFSEGNYEAGKLLYKCVLKTSDVQTLVRLRELKVTIDVPDVFDKGSVETSAANAVRVFFSRNFNSEPAINATLVSGVTIGTPKVINVTLDYFDLELLDNLGNRIAGKIHWQARGY